jgi:hypothetical protein
MLFGLAGSASRPIVAGERRAEERFDAPACWSGLGWRSWRGFRVRHALVINLSRRGALVFLDEPPPTHGRFWFYLETPRQKAVIPATTCEVRRTRLGQAAVRIMFSGRCPFDLFEAAVCGLPAVDPRFRAGKPSLPDETGIPRTGSHS